NGFPPLRSASMTTLSVFFVARTEVMASAVPGEGRLDQPANPFPRFAVLTACGMLDPPLEGRTEPHLDLLRKGSFGVHVYPFGIQIGADEGMVGRGLFRCQGDFPSGTGPANFAGFPLLLTFVDLWSTVVPEPKHQVKPVASKPKTTRRMTGQLKMRL